MIELRTLGGVDLRSAADDITLPLTAQPKRLALLVFLSLEELSGYRRRDQVVGLFWPELDTVHARGALRQALHALRRAMGEGAILTRGEQEIGVNREALWCDAEAFRQHADAGRHAEALKLYRGDFLEGFYASDVAPEFDQWIAETRAGLRSRAAASAWALATAHREKGDLANAAALARRASVLALEDENGVARLISFLDELGDRGGALEVYNELVVRLRAEYEAEPSPETRALIDRVRKRTVATSRGPAAELRTPTPAPFLIPLGWRPSRSRPPPAKTSPTFVESSRYLVLVPSRLRSRAEEPGFHSRPYAVAVVPLQDLSGDTSRAYIAEGVTDQLITDLAQLGTLEVINRRTMMLYRGSRKTTRQIAEDLHADAVLSGTIQNFGDTVRMTAQIVLARGDRAIWAQTFEGSRGDLLRMQREAARTAAQSIRGELTPAQRTSLPRVRALIPKHSICTSRAGTTGISEAPDCSSLLAFSPKRSTWTRRLRLRIPEWRMPMCNWDMGTGWCHVTPFQKPARPRCAHWSSIRPLPSRMRPSRSCTCTTTGTGGRRNENSARDRTQSQLRHGARMVWIVSDGDGPVRRGSQAGATGAGAGSPVHRRCGHCRVGDVLRRRRPTRQGPAPDRTTRGQRIRVGTPLPRSRYEATHQPDSAMAQYEASGPLRKWVPGVAGEAYLLATLSRNAEARATLARLDSMRRATYVSAYAVALVHVALHEPDSAFAWLDRAVAEQTNWMVWLNRDPRWRPLRADPRFVRFTRRLGLPDSARPGNGLGDRLPHIPQGTPHRSARRVHLTCVNLPARHRRLQPMLETFAQRRCRATASRPTRDLQRRALVAEQLARQCAHVEDELLHREAHDRVGAKVARFGNARAHGRERRELRRRRAGCPRDQILRLVDLRRGENRAGSAVSGSRPSAAAVTTDSARRPIHAPLPSSPQTGPQPPQRAVAARRPAAKRDRAGAADEQHAGPSPNASSSAMLKSEWITSSAARSRLTSACQSSCRSVSRPAPATPTQSTRGVTCVISHDASASRTTSAITLAECSAWPGRTALPGPTVSAIVRPCSSATMACVFDPPPSIPITMNVMCVSGSRGRLRGRVRQRGKNSNEKRDGRADEHEPRPRDRRERRERGGQRRERRR